jgi:AraC family transcriptional regulator of adaptative response / DNA-3-methyladenine glycosylase II
MLQRPQDPEFGAAADFEALRDRVEATLAEHDGVAALARSSGMTSIELEALLRRHAHSSSEGWLRRLRIAAAARQLREQPGAASELAATLGFTSHMRFAREFERLMRLTPAAYRDWVRPRRGSRTSSERFELELPPRYRAEAVLAFHGRDPAGLCERVDAGRRIFKALSTLDGGVVLEIELGPRRAQCRAHAVRALSPGVRGELHECALRLLGLTLDVPAFETQVRSDAAFARLLAKRRGLRLPLMASAFEGLCWAIIGQQINLAFATSLRHTLIELCGTRVDGMIAHPTPAQLAALESDALTSRRYSRAKARYLLGVATAVADGRLALDALAAGSAVAAEQTLTSLHGVGTWTARYTLMRGMGFADCAPIGDVALAAALQRWRGLDARPGPDVVESLLAPYSPYRSLATCHLWASQQDRA